MRIRIRGEITLRELVQCIHEKLNELDEDYNVKFVRGTNLYITPTNGKGQEVICRRWNGEEVKIIESEGPYMSAAATYDI